MFNNLIFDGAELIAKATNAVEGPAVAFCDAGNEFSATGH
jgi:hypothetical protein